MFAGLLPIPTSGSVSRHDMRQIVWEFPNPLRGFKKNNPGCNCCPSATCNACAAGTSPEQWQVEFSGGITNVNCTDCADWLTGTYILTRLASDPCTWEGFFDPPCSGTGDGCSSDKRGISMSITTPGFYNLHVLNDIHDPTMVICFEDGWFGPVAQFGQTFFTDDCSLSRDLELGFQTTPQIGFKNCEWLNLSDSVICTVTPL